MTTTTTTPVVMTTRMPATPMAIRTCSTTADPCLRADESQPVHLTVPVHRARFPCGTARATASMAVKRQVRVVGTRARNAGSCQRNDPGGYWAPASAYGADARI